MNNLPKILSIPFHLVRFWYLESFEFFFRTLKNLILFLEEDLAVRLMFKLLFTPVFHDSSFVGQLISFVFRSIRIILGLISFIVVSALVISLWMLFLIIPVFAVYFMGTTGLVFKGLLFSGLVLFVAHLLSRPHRKISQIKSPSEIWSCSRVSPSEVSFAKLIGLFDVTSWCWYLETTPSEFSDLKFSLDQNLILTTALNIARQAGAIYLEPRHFFVSFLLTASDLDLKLVKLGLNRDDLIDGLKFYERKQKDFRRVYLWDEDFHITHLKGVNRGWLGVPTPYLDSASEDLTKKAGRTRITSFLGREEILANIIHLLSGSGRRSVLLVGEVGVGKKSLVEYLAKLIVAGDAPSDLATKRLVRLDLTKLISETQTQGELASRVNNIFEEIKYSNNIILFIDTLENFSEHFPLISPYLTSSDFQFLATTSDQGLHKISESSPSLVDKFITVELPPATSLETLAILEARALEAERYQKIQFSLKALKKIVEVSEQHIKDKVLPASALEIFDRSLKQSSSGGQIGVAEIETIIYSTLKIPIPNSKSGNQLLLDLEELICQRIIGQSEAVKVVSQTLKRAAVNLRDKKRPIGSFLFVGPTGVGKTELSKVLSSIYFKGAGQFLRFDMSEYQTDNSIDRLLGTGSGEGLFTDPVRHNPYSLILLDEFEKANPKVLNLFLQVLEDGRLTDGVGKTVDFTNTIMIATSNVGSLLIAQGIKDNKDYSTIKTEVFDELLKVFKPELVNRFDEVVVFTPLTPSELENIVTIKLSEVKKLLQDQGYLVEFDAGLVAILARQGFDPVLGARPLRRLIQDTIEARLSELILRATLQKGVLYKAGSELLSPPIP